MDKKIASTIKYFAVFDYFPNFMDVYTFFPIKTSKKRLRKLLKNKKYTVGEYSKNKIKNQKSKIKISEHKLNNWRFRAYLKLISPFPQIKLVGLSGSISMMNAGENDDIDLFIITAKNRLFTGRLITLVLAQLLGLRRSREARSSNNKICLNLFFDESNLKVPRFKQTEFVGHEVLQMKPIIVKGDIYERFLKANKWVFKLFPNSSWIISKVKNQKSKIQIKSQNYSKNFLIFNFIESILKKFQLHLINRHKTTEIITSTQLWFHPNDFEKKLSGLDK